MFIYNGWGTRLPGWKIPNPDEIVTTVPNWLLDAVKRGSIKMYKNKDNHIFEATIVQENGYERVRPNEWIVMCYEDDYMKMDDKSVQDGFKRFG